MKLLLNLWISEWGIESGNVHFELFQHRTIHKKIQPVNNFDYSIHQHFIILLSTMAYFMNNKKLSKLFISI